MLQNLTIDSFRPLVGSEFFVEVAEEKRIPLALERVESLTEKGQMQPRKREPFSIVFSGPLDTFFSQQTLPLSHPSLGKVNIFVVPIARLENRYQYEAIFT